MDIKQEIELAQSTEAMFSSIDAADAAIKREDRRQERFLNRVLLPVMAIILGIVAVVAIVNAQHALDSAAKGTIPPCSVYAYTSTPDLHGARADACYTENPDGGYSISTGDAVQTAAW